jgi:hypothetical protein
MRPTKPNLTCDELEFALQSVPRLALALECVPAREEHRLHSFLFFGTRDLTQWDAEQTGDGEPLVGHA